MMTMEFLLCSLKIRNWGGKSSYYENPLLSGLRRRYAKFAHQGRGNDVKLCDVGGMTL